MRKLFCFAVTFCGVVGASPFSDAVDALATAPHDPVAHERLYAVWGKVLDPERYAASLVLTRLSESALRDLLQHSEAKTLDESHLATFELLFGSLVRADLSGHFTDGLLAALARRALAFPYDFHSELAMLLARLLPLPTRISDEVYAPIREWLKEDLLAMPPTEASALFGALAQVLRRRPEEIFLSLEDKAELSGKLQYHHAVWAPDRAEIAKGLGDIEHRRRLDMLPDALELATHLLERGRAAFDFAEALFSTPAKPSPARRWHHPARKAAVLAVLLPDDAKATTVARIATLFRHEKWIIGRAAELAAGWVPKLLAKASPPSMLLCLKALVTPEHISEE